mgnify:CR=1 FL=1
MAEYVVHSRLPGRLVMLGCGSIGQATLPLILRHLDVTPERIAIVTADGRGREEAAEYGIAFHEVPLTQDNYREVLEPLVGAGDCWIADRNFCTYEILFGVMDRGAAFVIRQHGSMGGEAAGPRLARGRCETGEVFGHRGVGASGDHIGQPDRRLRVVDRRDHVVALGDVDDEPLPHDDDLQPGPVRRGVARSGWPSPPRRASKMGFAARPNQHDR